MSLLSYATERSSPGSRGQYFALHEQLCDDRCCPCAAIPVVVLEILIISEMGSAVFEFDNPFPVYASVDSCTWHDIAGVEVETWILKKIRGESTSNCSEISECRLHSAKIRAHPKLSAHQMSPGGVVSHSSSWTAAACELHEVLLPRLFRLRHCGRRFKSTHPPVPCCYWIPT